MNYLLVSLVAFLCLSKSWAEETLQLAECLRHIHNPIQQQQQNRLFGEYDQYIFDDDPILYIRGLGLSTLISKRPRIKLSGDAVQGRDFSVAINDTHLTLTLNSMKRYCCLFYVYYSY